MKRGILSKTSLLVTGTISLALSVITVPAIAGERPLSDFVSRLETWCAVLTDDFRLDCASSYYGGPACANGGFTFPALQDWFDPNTGVTASIDQFGPDDRLFFGGSLGTTLDGSVAEGSAPGGLAAVKVSIHTSHALTRAFDIDGNALFGHFIDEVLNGAPPTLGDSLTQITFTNTAVGAPLPDFAQLQFCPMPGQQFTGASISAQASGPLRAAFNVPEGTPGRLQVTQKGLLGLSQSVPPQSRVGLDAFPVEHIIIRATGN